MTIKLLNKSFLTIIIFFLTLSISGKEMKIGILRNVKMKQVLFKVNTGSFSINSIQKNLNKDQSIKISISGNKVRVKQLDNSLVLLDTLFIKNTSENSIFSVKGIVPSLRERKYYAKLKAITFKGISRNVSSSNSKHR